MKGSMPRFVVLTLAVAAVAVLAIGAANATAQEGSFSGIVEVNTINVDVIVTHKGEPVTNLTADDFAIYEDGAAQKITNFAKVVDGVVHFRMGSEAGETIEDAKDLRFRRHVALVFDLNFIEKPWLARAVKTIIAYVRENGGKDVDWSVVAIGAEPVVVVPFTADLDRVVDGLNAVRSLPTYRLSHAIDVDVLHDPLGTSLVYRSLSERMSPDQAEQQAAFAHYRERSLTNRSVQVYMVLARGLVDIFRNMTNAPGKKSCLLVTGNMTLNPRMSILANSTPQTYPPSSQRGFDPQLASANAFINELWQAVIRYANTAGFRLYAVNAMTLEEPSDYLDASNRNVGGPLPSANNFDWESLPRMLAEQTGGRYMNTNTVAPAIEAMDHEIRTYYSLAFQAQHSHDNKYHKIKVKVKRKGLKLRYRPGLYDFDPEVLLAQQMASPAQFDKVGGNLPLVVKVDTKHKGGQLQVAATAITPLNQLTFIPDGQEERGEVTVFLAVYDVKGNILDLKRHDQSLKIPSKALSKAGNYPFTYTMKFNLPEGSYTVAMALFDKPSGNSGLANARVIAP